MAYRTAAEVGAVVMQLRERAGMDRAEVASHLGIDEAAVRQIERGERRISAWELAVLAELLRVEPGVLLNREEPGAVLLRSGGAGEAAVQEALALFEVVLREVLAARAMEDLL